ncbi:MAG: hypothetical protein WD011_06515 [Nitriliruptoraceae bacterium]
MTARVTSATISDVRSVFDQALRVPLETPCTVLVGPNRSGSSTVLFAIAAGLDATVRFRPARDLPRGRPGRPRVAFTLADGTPISSEWDIDRGTRSTDRPFDRRVVHATVTATPRDLVRATPFDLTDPVVRHDVAQHLRDAIRPVIPEVSQVAIDVQGRVEVRDELDVALPPVGVRALVAVGIARAMMTSGHEVGAVLIEAPEAFLHPAAQEAFGARWCQLASQLDAPVVVATSSPFAIPRTADVSVLALARDDYGRTSVTGSARGDRPHARLLGGLLGDPGVADVLDRIAEIGPDTRAALVVEGGTDEAYLFHTAERLGRLDVLEGVAILPAGGAMPAALETILLRAETRVPVFVLLDHDDAGRRARDTLVSRFGFTRATSIVTYADVIEGGPPGVEAETLFDVDLVRRFVAEHGPAALERERREHGVMTVDLTSSGKAAFVGWLNRQPDLGSLDRWNALLDLLADRFDGDRSV